MKTKEQTMLEVFEKNPQCSVGDIVYALRTKWHGRKTGSYTEDAINFLNEARKNYHKKRDEYFKNKRDRETIQSQLKNFSIQMAKRLNELGLDGSAFGFGEYVELIVDERASQRGNVSNAFETIGL